MNRRPDVPMTTGEIADELEWSVRRTSRWLDGLAERDPSIIVWVRGRRMTTIASLRRVCPDIARRFATDTDVRNIREEFTEQSSELRLLAKEVGELKAFVAKANAWLKALTRKVTALEQPAANLAGRPREPPTSP